MLRNAFLFLAALLLALSAGRAFWVWLGENPFNMSGPTYVEFFQQLDRRIAVPLRSRVLAGLYAQESQHCFGEATARPFIFYLRRSGLAWLAASSRFSSTFPSTSGWPHGTPLPFHPTTKNISILGGNGTAFDLWPYSRQ